MLRENKDILIKAKTWCKLSLRAVFGLYINEIAKDNPDLIVVTADTSTSAGLDRFRKNFPLQNIDVGIAEQNLVGVSSGLALDGSTVFSVTFASFLVLRAYEQIKVMLGYNRANVQLVGIGSGMALADLGYTHCCNEDVAILRQVEGIKIYCPADVYELMYCVDEMLRVDGPSYLRLTGDAIEGVFPSESLVRASFQITSRSINEKVLVVSTGVIKSVVLKVLESASNEGFNIGHLHLIKIWPLPEKELIEILVDREYDKIIVVEEHHVFGGLYSMLCEVKNKYNLNLQIVGFGMEISYKPYLNYSEALQDNGISIDKLLAEVCNSFKRK